MSVVVKVVDSILSCNLNHRQFQAMMDEVNAHYEEVCWLIHGAMLSRVHGSGHLCWCRRFSIASLREEFTYCFAAVRLLAVEVMLITDPFDFPVDDLPAHLQMELVELHYNDELKANTYSCEQLFSKMKYTKSRLLSQLSDRYLNDILLLSASSIIQSTLHGKQNHPSH
ncbi:hypothetical protein O3P69_008078 [Scylla paramamosain]|uniref:Uncharacterized protein n=1 Tax=Scylla paramamosain TaxID=85552 RepID=A0AAW0T025_SCYPA